MKTPYVSELQANQIVTAILLVQQKDVRQKKTGEPYLSLVLGDRTGEIEAKMWDNVAEVMDTFERDDFLKIRGLIQVFQNRLQLTVHRLQKHPDEQIDFTDFFPAAARNGDEMMADLRGIIDTMQNTHLKGLLNAMMSDAAIVSRYKLAPAAKNVHHAYLGGLIEHVLSMCGLAKLCAAHYRDIDVDLLLAGVILHDIGKIWELTYDRSFGYSSEGQLLGHIVIGLRMVDEKLRTMAEFPPRLRTLLEHLIVSHHGELEFGSPRVPACPEALLLHHIDNMDSKMECMRSFIEKDRYVEGCWTGYSSILERAVLKKQKYLEPAAAKTQEAAASAVGPVGAAPSAPPPRPAPPPAPAAPQHQRGPQLGVLGEKLQSALRRDG